MWMRTGKQQYRLLARFWTKIFAVSFAMGVVSGIVLSYQFGTNWSRFSATLGNVIGPMIGYEVLVAFFLEATFLGVLLFGWDRVPPWLHTFSAIAVAIGTLLSSFTILSANSWMQTPAGFEMRDGVAYPLDWLAIVFNPSFPYRLAHMVTASYLTTSFVVLAVGARYLIAGTHFEHGRTMVRMAVGFAAIVAPLQLFIGDQHGLNTLAHQPLKIAAIEALGWQSSGRARVVRLAGREHRNEQVCGDDPAWRLASPHPPLGRSVSRFDECSGTRPATRRAAIFRFPDHGRHRSAHDRCCADRRRVVVAWALVDRSVVPVASTACLVDRLRGSDLRMDRHRNRPATMGGVRRPANSRRGIAARRTHCRHDAGAVRPRLQRRVRDGHLLHQQAHCTRTTNKHVCTRGCAMESYLPVIWAAIIGLEVAMYVVLDGFDLGIGILFPLGAPG
jgi:Cytochrome bd terminal oxidase subunit I